RLGCRGGGRGRGGRDHHRPRSSRGPARTPRPRPHRWPGRRRTGATRAPALDGPRRRPEAAARGQVVVVDPPGDAQQRPLLMAYYLDTSAAVKLVVSEPDTAALTAWL